MRVTLSQPIHGGPAHLIHSVQVRVPSLAELASCPENCKAATWNLAKIAGVSPACALQIAPADVANVVQALHEIAEEAKAAADTIAEVSAV